MLGGTARVRKPPPHKPLASFVPGMIPRRAARWLPLLALGLGGCSVLCKGPSCEDEWPATRIAVHSGVDLTDGTRDVWADAIATFDGSLLEGARWSVATYGDRLIVGQPEAGQVSVTAHRAADGPLVPVARWVDEDGEEFGANVLADDFEGDGTFDLWVAAPGYRQARGALLLFPDAETAHTVFSAEEAALTILGGSPGDRLGERVVTCADMTGDGLPEIVVTAPWFTANEALPEVPELAGAIFLLRSELLGAASGVVQPWEMGHTWWGEEVGASAGQALSCQHDLTGDGIPDLVVGAPWQGKGDGAVYILNGGTFPPDGRLDAAASRVLTPNLAGSWFGASLVTLELDGVGPAELVVGAPGATRGRGEVAIFSGRELADLDFPEPLATITAASLGDGDHLGRWLAAGDIDGDGLGDVLVGAPDLRDGPDGFDTGRAWIWRGSGRRDWRPRFDVGTADITLLGRQPFQRVGRGPLLTDLDGDGLDDVVLPTRWKGDRLD